MNTHLPLKTTAVTTKRALLACFRVTGLAEIVRQLDGIIHELCLDTVTPAWVQDEAMDVFRDCIQSPLNSIQVSSPAFQVGLAYWEEYAGEIWLFLKNVISVRQRMSFHTPRSLSIPC